jgi:hypothetical protein
MSDKKKKVWSDDVPWSVRDSHAQKAKEKGSRDKQGIKDSPRYYIPILQIIKRLFGRGD